MLSGFVFSILAPARYGPLRTAVDNLGDDIPPDEINILRSGQHYGWPYCYGNNIPDPSFNASGRCTGTQGSVHDMQAHSAPFRDCDFVQRRPSFQRNGRETF